MRAQDVPPGVTTKENEEPLANLVWVLKATNKQSKPAPTEELVKLFQESSEHDDRLATLLEKGKEIPPVCRLGEAHNSDSGVERGRGHDRRARARKVRARPSNPPSTSAVRRTLTAGRLTVQVKQPKRPRAT